jgi:hypothetical protein
VKERKKERRKERKKERKKKRKKEWNYTSMLPSGPSWPVLG